MTDSLQSAPRWVEGGAMRRWQDGIPLLYAAWPILLLYARNDQEVRLAALLLPLLLVLGAGSGLVFVARRLVADPAQRLVLGSLFWLFFFSCGCVFQLAPRCLPALAASRPACVAAWGAVFALLCWRLLVSHGSISGIARGLAAAGLLLVAGNAGSIIQGHTRGSVALPAAGIVAGPQRAARSGPDIYHLVLDAYAREDVLRELYGYDNRPFLAALRRRGFSVAPQARANYAYTTLATAALFRMHYLDDLARRLGPRSCNRRVCGEAINTSPLLPFLKDRGYTLVAFESGYDPAQLTRVDHLLKVRRGRVPTLLSHSLEFHRGLAEMTPLGARAADWLAAGWAGERNARADLRLVRIRYALESLPLPRSYPRPLFVEAHVLCPHLPYLLCESKDSPTLDPHPEADQGTPAQTARRRAYDLRMYPQQVRRLNRMVLAAVDRIIAQDPEAVILLHSDHGPGLDLNQQQPWRTNFTERMSILMAARWPRRPPLPAGLSPVNLFRLLLNREFGTSLPLLPDESYFSTWAQPYRLYRVTDGRITGKGTAAGPGIRSGRGQAQ